MSDQPTFRFYPNAYAEGGPFERSQKLCEVCDQEAGWLYTGEIYTEAEPPPVCARCLASGALRERLLPDSFTLQDISIEDADAALAEQVLTATPNVASINPFDWPVIDGKPLAFLGEGDGPAMKANAEAQAAIRAAFAELGEGDGHASHALVFRTLEGDTYVAVIDLD